MPSDSASPSACMDPCRMARLPPPKKPPGPGLNSPAGAPAAVGVAMPEWGEATPLKAAWLLLRGMPKSCTSTADVQHTCQCQLEYKHCSKSTTCTVQGLSPAVTRRNNRRNPNNPRGCVCSPLGLCCVSCVRPQSPLLSPAASAQSQRRTGYHSPYTAQGRLHSGPQS
jgi:hypothetical protein